MPENLLEGLNLMLFGMGFVFVFLTALVLFTSIMSKIINTFDRGKSLAIDELENNPQTHQSNNHLTAVISSAIHSYKSRNKR